MFNPTPRNYYGNARYDTDGAAHDNAADDVTNAAAATPNLDGESGTVLSWIPDRPAPSDPTVFGQAHYVPNSVLPKHVEPHIAAHFRALWVKLCGSVWELFQCASNADTPVARARYAELLRNLQLQSSDARDYVVIEAKAFGDRGNSRFACPVSTIPRLNSRVIVAHDRGVDNMLVMATPGSVRDRPPLPPHERKAIADLLRKGQVVLGPVTPVDQRHRDKLLGLSTPLARLLEDAFDLLSSAKLHSLVNVDSVVIRPDMDKAVVYVRCPEMVQVNTLAVAANWLLGCRVWIRQTRERGLRVGPVLDENWLSVDALIGIRLNGDADSPPTKSDGDDSTTATTTGDASAATSASTTPPPSAHQQRHGWGNFVVAASTQAHPHPSYPSFRRAAHP